MPKFSSCSKCSYQHTRILCLHNLVNFTRFRVTAHCELLPDQVDVCCITPRACLLQPFLYLVKVISKISFEDFFQLSSALQPLPLPTHSLSVWSVLEAHRLVKFFILVEALATAPYFAEAYIAPE